ncbi:MAG: methyltransferase domain-containing protein [Nitrospinae bacterium]|nr:methyltransferase domain-containing protein [Nitrospinota bacterium]
MNEQVKSNFELGAEKFDRIYEPSEEKSFFSRWFDKRFRKTMYFRFDQTLENIKNEKIQSVLDVGCGSGRYCVEYLKMGKKVVGIDMASNMLKIAKETCFKTVPKGNIEFIYGNYMDHRFEEQYDAAVLTGLFDYIEDAESMVKKLKTDVKHMVVGSFPRSDNFLNKIRKVRYFFKNCPLYLYSREKLEKMFRSVGIENYTITETDREFYVRLNL